ncbi:MAG: beta strand repeat-containing protein, partial [Gaiellaceae bacterium]
AVVSATFETFSTVVGRDVSIVVQAGRVFELHGPVVSAPTVIGLNSGALVSDFVGSMSELWDEIITAHPIFDMAQAQSTATIDVDAGASIDARSFLAHAVANASAAAQPEGGSIGLGIAVAIAQPTATVDYAGTLTTSGDATLQAETDAQTSAVADTTTFSYLAKKAPAYAGAAAFAISIQQAVAQTVVEDGAMLTVGGDLAVDAGATSHDRTFARSTAGTKGSVGFAVALALESTNVAAELDATATVGGDVTVDASMTTAPVDTTKFLDVLPGVASGVAAQAGVGTDSKGDFLDDSQANAYSAITGPVWGFVGDLWNGNYFKSNRTNSQNPVPQNTPAPPPNKRAGALAFEYEQTQTTARIGNGGANGDGLYGKVQAGGSVAVDSEIQYRPNLSASSQATNSSTSTDVPPKPSTAATRFDGSYTLAVGVYLNEADATISQDAQVDAKGAVTVQAQSLDDYVFTYGTDVVAAASADPDYTTSDGTVTIQHGQVVEADSSHTGTGEAGVVYEYLPATPTTVDLQTADFGDTSTWLPLGNLDEYRAVGAVQELTTYLNNNLGLDANLVDAWSQATAGGDTQEDFAGSAMFMEVQNHATALIDSGAQVNQDSAYRTTDQVVTVEAQSDSDLVTMGGNIRFPGVQGNINSWTIDPVKPGGGTTTNGYRAIGFTLQVYDIRGSADATIADSAAVHASALNVTATTEDMVIVVGASGGKAGNGSDFNGAFGITLVTEETIAQIAQGAIIDVTGAVKVSAKNTTYLLGFYGGVAEGMTAGYGATVGVNYVQRDTEAIVGSKVEDAATDPSGSLTAGSVSITATNGGFVGTFTVSGSQASDNSSNASQGSTGQDNADGSSVNDAGQAQTPDNGDVYDQVLQELESNPRYGTPSSQLSEDPPPPPTGKSGIGISGAVSLEIVDDDAQAYIRRMGTVTAPGGLTLNATDATILVALAGGVAEAGAAGGGEGSQRGIAGAVTIIIGYGTTDAFVDTPGSFSVGALTVDASRTGDVVSLTAGMAGAKGRQGDATAGSVAITVLDETTATALDGVPGTASGLVSLDAHDGRPVIVVAGSSAFGGNQGVGAALAFTSIFDTVSSAVDQASTFAYENGLTIKAVSDGLIVAVTGSVGQGSDDYGAAGTLSVNVIANTIEAQYLNSAAGSGSSGDVSLLADDGSSIWAFAGGFASGKSSGFGVALALNFILNTVKTNVSGSTLTATGTLTLTSEETGELIGVAVGGAGSQGYSVAGAIGADQTDNTITTSVSDGTVSGGGAVLLKANDEETIVSVAGGLSLPTTSGAGASVGVNLIGDTTQVQLDDAIVTSTGSTVTIDGNGDEVLVAVGVGGTGGDRFGFGGSISVNQVENSVLADVSDSSSVNAQGDISIDASDDTTVVVVAGGYAKLNKTAIGAAVATAQVANTIDAVVDGSSVT